MILTLFQLHESRRFFDLTLDSIESLDNLNENFRNTNGRLHVSLYDYIRVYIYTISRVCSYLYHRNTYYFFALVVAVAVTVARRSAIGFCARGMDRSAARGEGGLGLGGRTTGLRPRGGRTYGPPVYVIGFIRSVLFAFIVHASRPVFFFFNFFHFPYIFSLYSVFFFPPLVFYTSARSRTHNLHTYRTYIHAHTYRYTECSGASAAAGGGMLPRPNRLRRLFRRHSIAHRFSRTWCIHWRARAGRESSCWLSLLPLHQPYHDVFFLRISTRITQYSIWLNNQGN